MINKEDRLKFYISTICFALFSFFVIEFFVQSYVIEQYAKKITEDGVTILNLKECKDDK